MRGRREEARWWRLARLHLIGPLRSSLSAWHKVVILYRECFYRALYVMLARGRAFIHRSAMSPHINVVENMSTRADVILSSEKNLHLHRPKLKAWARARPPRNSTPCMADASLRLDGAAAGMRPAWPSRSRLLLRARFFWCVHEGKGCQARLVAAIYYSSMVGGLVLSTSGIRLR